MQPAIGNLKAAGVVGVVGVVFWACALTVPACRPTTREQMGARATDEWIRSYPLEQGGRVSLFNRNGSIDVEGVEGSTVEVRAERVTHATTEKTAKDLLPRIAIVEDVKPDLVSIRTEGIEGLLVGVSFEVIYHVKVPRSAVVRVQNVNGNIAVKDLVGRLVANTNSGDIKGENLGGGVETRTVNGETAVNLVSLGSDPVSLRGTNGVVQLTLPAEANANLTAACVNGRVTMTGLTFEPTGEPGPERGRGRRVRGRLNQGGTAIELQTVNGSIAISARDPSAVQD